MAKKRGLLAEYQRQVRLAEQRKRQANQRAARAERERQAELRRLEREQRASERAEAAAARLTEQELKRREREALAAHQASMQAEVDDLNAALAETQAELDGILTSTLDVDDYVDLDSLRVTAEHPPFAHDHLRTPTAPPPHVPEPPRPERQDPEVPFGFFNRKRRQEEAEAAAEQNYRIALQQWEADLAEHARWKAQAEATYVELERKRKENLENAFNTYRQECAAREKEAQARNQALDALIAGLGYGTPEAVNEYISIVLANSVYPEDFAIEHDATFEPAGAELSMVVHIPAPDSFSSVKAYRYVKASDEITSTPLSQKAQKDRYAAVLNAVALRTLHEVFEADRRGIIQAISLEVRTSSVSPATGRPVEVPLLGVAVSREAFVEIDLSAVVPSATLEHLNAAVSKNPLALTPANLSGVRKA